jgi:thiol-disulfide isomerase/thioredoxin
MLTLFTLLLLASPPEPQLSVPAARAAGLEVMLLDGRRVPLADLLPAGRPVVVEFWATWCSPCMKMIPHFVELNRRHRDDGLVVLGLSVEDPDKHGNKVRAAIKARGIDYTVAFASREVYALFNEKTEISLPKTLVFDGEGRLVEYSRSYSPLTSRRIAAAAERAIARSRAGAK